MLSCKYMRMVLLKSLGIYIFSEYQGLLHEKTDEGIVRLTTPPAPERSSGWAHPPGRGIDLEFGFD